MAGRRRELRPASFAVSGLAERLAPASTLGAVQRVWEGVAGPAVAAEATPTGEASGVLTITCSSAVWAQELDLMGQALIERLNGALGADRIRALRCQTVPARGWEREPR
jgi:predicted nucleic acid-binding Zn ribbon protein